MTPAEPRPAASVLLVRPGQDAPLEVYMIRRQKSMRFLGGFYAFPGGKVDPEDALPALHGRCRGLDPAARGAAIPSADGASRARLLGRRGARAPRGDRRPGRPGRGRARHRLRRPGGGGASGVHAPRRDRVAGTPRRAPRRRGLVPRPRAAQIPLALHHPPSSPIRFSARFFLAPVPAGQRAHLHEEEASEGLLGRSRRGLSPVRGSARCRWPSPRTRGSRISPSSTRWTCCGRPTRTAATRSTASTTALDAAGLKVPRRAPGAAGAP